MIQKIAISNFFSIREKVEISFEASKDQQLGEDWIKEVGGFRLLKAMLLYGSNGSGKTNILWALEFLRNVVFKVPRDLDSKFRYKQFSFDPAYLNKETSFDLFFFIGQTRYNYQLLLTPDFIKHEEMRQYHHGNQSRRVFIRDYDEETGKSTVKFGPWVGLTAKDKHTIEEAATKVVSVLGAYSIRNIGSELLTEIRDYFKYQFFRVYGMGENADEEVARVLQHDSSLRALLIKMMESFHSNIIDVQVEEKSQPVSEEARKFLMQINEEGIDKEEIAKFQTIQTFRTHYLHKTPLGEFSLEDQLQSEGTRAFIRCLTLFYKAIKGNWLIALDEFGAGMQAKSQNLLLNFFLKFSKGSQLIIATQSLGLLDNEPRRDSIAIISKDEIGQTIANQKIVRKIHKNIKLRQAYLTGKFTSIDPSEPDIDLNEEYECFNSLLFGEIKEGGAK